MTCVPRLTRLATIALLCAARSASAEQAEASLGSGDTAWILASTALVLFMTIPGLALFYGGLVRTKNVLSVLMQCFVLSALVTVLWLFYGYSIAFDNTGMEAGVTTLHSFVGGLGKVFLSGVGVDTLSGTIPESLFFAFQLTFAIIMPALIVGAFAERLQFKAMLLFMISWFSLVYLPICHMTWGGRAAFSATWACSTSPAGSSSTSLRACMLWFGWFGFNAGSALGANGSAAMALVVTQISAATAALTWAAIEWARAGKPSVLGIVTGSIAGLAAVTPASGFIGPFGGFAIGLLSGCACYWAAVVLKMKLGYDDSLDVFGVHGVGGFVGTVLAGVFASQIFGGLEGDLAIGRQVGIQLMAALITAGYCAIVSYGLAKAIDATVGLRTDEIGEQQGLDLTDHGEVGYNL